MKDTSKLAGDDADNAIAKKDLAGPPELNTDTLTDDKKRQIDNDLSVNQVRERLPLVSTKNNASQTSQKPHNDASDTLANDVDDEQVGIDDRAVEAPRQPGRLKHFFAGYGRHKKWTIPLTILVLLGVVAAVPWSRYFILGQFLEKPYGVELIDAKTNVPISGAKLTIDSSSAVTDAKGKATLRAKVGKHNLSIDKKYYTSYTKSIFVGIANQKQPDQLQLTATGRQVPIAVVNKITGKPIADATFKAAGTEVKTDKDGKATVVLPADKPTLQSTLTAKGYNDAAMTIQVTEAVVKENNFQLVPTGKIYFLSKLSGKIDVVKTDLDGSNRQTVVAGTGKEEDGNTVLLASRDWKYLAMLSKRDSSPAKLYLIETSTDKMTTMDEGSAVFNLIGWSGSNFAYWVARNGVQPWQPNKTAVKTYSADKKQLLTVDQSEAEGDENNYKIQTLSSFNLLNDKLVYTVAWNGFQKYYYGGTSIADKTAAIREVTVGTQTKKDLKAFPADQYYFQRTLPYSPTEIYFELYPQAGSSDNKNVYFEYDDGQVKTADTPQDTILNGAYPTYLISPSGKQAFWSEQRDGRDTFFVGDAEGTNPKQVAALDEFQVYGWYSDDYLLMSKKGSELYILPTTGGTELKVTDYHKPQISYRGYGGGYGGL